MNQEIIAAIVAGAISLALEIVPGLSDLWDKVGTNGKALTVFLLSLGVPFILVGLACGGIDVGVGATCPNPADPQMWADALLLGLAAYFGSQATFRALSAPLGENMRGGVG